MQTRFEIETDVVRPGVPMRAFEYNETGLVGEYRAYWNSRKHIFTLYPSYNPMLVNRRKDKFSIAEQLVRIKRPA